MKTAGTNLSKITRIMILACSILGFSHSEAGNGGMPAPDSSYVEPIAWAPAFSCRDYTNPPSILSMDPMYEDPYYWVNYLYCTVNTEEESENPDCTICEMETHPDYWIDSLNEITKED